MHDGLQHDGVCLQRLVERPEAEVPAQPHMVKHLVLGALGFRVGGKLVVTSAPSLQHNRGPQMM